MAKSKKSRKKKQAASDSKHAKLESKLFGYWKKGSWGELVTLYLRHWDRVIQTRAAHLWDPAVFNLLLRTTFEDQDFTLLQNLHNELNASYVLSEPNRKCLRVIEILLSVEQGRANPIPCPKMPRKPLCSWTTSLSPRFCTACSCGCLAGPALCTATNS